MERLKSLLGKRIKGIPVLAFALVGAGILFVFSMKTNKAKAAADATPASDDIENSADAASGQQPAFVANTPAQTTYSEPTNDTWLRNGLTFLIGKNTKEADGRNALTKYLNGEDLTTLEAQLKDSVVRQFGLPPQLPGSGGTATAQVRYHITKASDNGRTVLDVFRAYHPGAGIGDLKKLNPNVIPTQAVHPNMQIRVA